MVGQSKVGTWVKYMSASTVMNLNAGLQVNKCDFHASFTYFKISLVSTSFIKILATKTKNPHEAGFKIL